MNTTISLRVADSMHPHRTRLIKNNYSMLRHTKNTSLRSSINPSNSSTKTIMHTGTRTTLQKSSNTRNYNRIRKASSLPPRQQPSESAYNKQPYHENQTITAISHEQYMNQNEPLHHEYPEGPRTDDAQADATAYNHPNQ